MAIIRDCKELAGWTLSDWLVVLADWDELTEEGYVDVFGNRLEKRGIDELAEILNDKGYETQDQVDQLWIDVSVGAELLGTLESGFIVEAPKVFGGSEGGTGDEA